MAASLDGEEGSSGKAAVSLDAAELGAPDCELVGTAWSIPAHRQALLNPVPLYLWCVEHPVVPLPAMPGASLPIGRAILLALLSLCYAAHVLLQSAGAVLGLENRAFSSFWVGSVYALMSLLPAMKNITHWE